MIGELQLLMVSLPRKLSHFNFLSFLLMVLACIRPVFSRCKRYLRRFNLELQKAGSRGLSILVAAGDSGVGCSPTGTNLLDLPYILDRQVSLI